jgi:hypothetical protein
VRHKTHRQPAASSVESKNRLNRINISNYHAIEQSDFTNLRSTKNTIISDSLVAFRSSCQPVEAGGISQFMAEMSHGVDAQPAEHLI